MSSAGLPIAISKMVSERIARGRPDEARRVFHVALVVASSLGVMFSLILYFGSYHLVTLFGWPRSYYALLALTPTVFFVAVMAVFRGYFQGMQNTVPTAISQIVEQVFNAFFSVFFAWFMMRNALSYIYGGDPVAWGAAGGQLGTSVGAFVGLAIIFTIFLLRRRNINKSIDFYMIGARDVKQPPLSIARELIFMAVPIILGTAIFSISNIIDLIMVRPLLESAGRLDAEVLYGQLMGKYVPITNIPVMLSTALAVAAIPSIASSIVKREQNSVTEKINTTLRISMLITIPSAVGVGVLSHQIIQLVFPSQPDGGELLMIGSISIIFLALYQISAGILQAIGKLLIPVFAAFLGVLLKIILNLILVPNPNLHIVGVVLSTIACYVLASAICWYFIKKYIKIKIDFVNILVKPAIASLVMGLGCFVIYYAVYFTTELTTVSTIVSIIFGIALYFIFLVIVGGLRKSDVLMLPMGNRLFRALERRRWINK